MKRVRNHVNPLKMRYALQAKRRRAPLALPDGEVEVELGCANAQFLFERAAQRPHVTCIGVEIREDLVADVNERAAVLGHRNVRAVFANINEELDGIFPDERLARAFLNFPDPWFKRRHHKRRVLTAEVASAIARKLRSDGELLFQSDVWDLALDAMAVLEATDALRNTRGPWSFLRQRHPFDARSQREERCELDGLPIWRMLYRKA